MKLSHSIIGIAKTAVWAEHKFNVHSNQLFVDTGIEPERLIDPHAQVIPREEIQFYRNLVQHCPTPDLAVKAGFQLTASSYGVWGLAIQSCDTLNSGIQMGMKYIDFTYTFNRIFYEENEEYGFIVIEENENLGDLAPFMVLRDCAAIVRLIFDGLKPELPFDSINLTHKHLSDHKQYENDLKCRITTGFNRNEVVIPKSQLPRRLNQANSLTWKMCCEHLDAQYQERKIKTSYVEQVQSFIKAKGPSLTNMESVARALKLSPRTLRDRLAAEGSSYKEIVDNERKEQAAELLRDSNLTLEQVAEKLGYSDATSLSHACKRWFNKAPRAVHVTQDK